MSPVFHRRNLGFGGIIAGLVGIFITIGGHYGIVVCLGLIGVVVSVLHFRRELNRRADDIVINSGRPHVAAPQKTAYGGLFNLANGIVDSPKLHGTAEFSKVGNEEISIEKSGFIEADDMNRRSSFTPGSLKHNSNWKSGLGSGSTGLGRRHSINLHGGRPNVSYIHAASPAARSPVSVRLSPVVRTGGLFSPNVLNELSDNGGTNGRSPVISSASGLGAMQKQPLPKVHRVRDQDESYYGSPLNSPSHNNTPRATQQAQYSLLGLLPQVRLDRPNKPVLAERNRNMGRVTVKIAPPDTLKLNQTGSSKLKDIREERNQKTDDILTILRERRKRTATDDEDGDNNTTSTEDHTAKRRRQGSAVNGGMDQSVTKSIKEMDLSPTSLNLKRRALHDRSPTQGAEKRFKSSVKRAGSCVNEIQASYSSSRKLRQSNSRQSSLASSRRSSFSQSMISSDPGLDQSELGRKLTQKAAPSVEMTEGSCSPSISNTSAVSTPASSITGTADDQGSTDSTIAKRLLRASPAFGAHLAKDKVEESPRDKQKPVMLKNESSVKRRQGSLLITNNDDYSKMKTAQYPVSHEDLEKDRKLAEERVQKMLQKAQKSTSDSEKLKKSLFGELPPQSPVSTASTSGSAVSSSASAAVTASTSAFTLVPPTVITSSVASAFAEGKTGISVAATTASSASLSTTDTTPKLTLTTGGSAGGLTAGGLTAGGLTAGGLTASSGISGSLTSTPTLTSASATATDQKSGTAALNTVASITAATSTNGPTTIDLSAGKAQQAEAPKSLTAGSSSAISFGTATTSPAVKGSLFGLAPSAPSIVKGTTGPKKGFTFGSQGKKDEPAASQVKQEEPKSLGTSFAAPGGGFAFGAQTQAKKEAAAQPAISQQSSSTSFPSVFSSVAQSASSGQGMPTTTNAVSTVGQQPSVKMGVTSGATSGSFAFGNTSGSTNSSTGSMFGQKSATPAFNAVFGQGSASSSSPAAVTQTALTNSVFGQSGTQGPGAAMIGQNTNSTTASTSSTSMFGQNAPPASTSSTSIFGQNVNPTPAPASTSSIFGQSGDTAKQSIFGQNTSTAPKAGTASVFGQPNTNSIFGQSVNASKQQASSQENKPTSGFQFGQNSSAPAQPAFGAAKPSSNTSGTGFTFQSTSTANTGFGAQSSSNGVFAFGSSGSAANTGGTSNTNSVFGTSQSIASPFGANMSSTSNMSNPFQPKASATSNPAPAAKTSLFQFGNTTPAKETTKTNTTTNAPFAFGGAPASTASQSGASPFTFGQNTQAKPEASSSNGLFQFGANPTSATSSATTTQSGVFGASQPMFGQSNSTTGGVFGSAVSTTSSAPPPAFGQVASNAGSFSSPPAFPAPAQQPASGGFNFQSAMTTPANKGFNFNASANQQSSPAAFQFGQNSSTPAFGGSPAQFASPTPSTPQMFSLGAGSTNPRSRTTQRARRTRPTRK